MSDKYDHIHPLDPGRKPSGYWTYERCKVAAAEFTGLNQWNTEHHASYTAAYKSGWHLDIAKGLGWNIRDTVSRGYWTKKLCKEQAANFHSLAEWICESYRSYQAAYRNGWHREIAEEFGWDSRVLSGYWTRERCKEQAAKFNGLKRWNLGHNASYLAAVRNKWQRDIADELGWEIGLQDRENWENVIYIYHYEGCIYIGKTNNPEYRHATHGRKEGSSVVFDFIPEETEPMYVHKYVHYNDSYEVYHMDTDYCERLEARLIRLAAHRGYKVLNKTHNPQWDGTKYSWEEPA